MNNDLARGNLPPMPWFGMDIGGTLAKMVYFDPSEFDSLKSSKAMQEIRDYLTSEAAFGEDVRREAYLQIDNVVIGGLQGSLHFIWFPTSAMANFLSLLKSKGMDTLHPKVCATGGGALKFEAAFKSELNLDLYKVYVIDSLILGIHFAVSHNPLHECFYWEQPLDEEGCKKIPFDFSQPFPYLVVNIGSGVSIYSVQSPGDFHRVTGSSIGGSTFLGLCCLLTGCETFVEAVSLAERGDNAHVDKFVSEIYGGDYTKFNLAGHRVACSFGKMTREECHSRASREDLARATLVTITNNIGSIAHACATNTGIDRVVFVGNFLRVNPLGMRRLANAVEFWSRGTRKALFFEHEGYFGAIGCLNQLVYL